MSYSNIVLWPFLLTEFVHWVRLVAPPPPPPPPPPAEMLFVNNFQLSKENGTNWRPTWATRPHHWRPVLKGEHHWRPVLRGKHHASCIIGSLPWEVSIIGSLPWQVSIIGSLTWQVSIIGGLSWKVSIIGGLHERCIHLSASPPQAQCGGRKTPRQTATTTTSPSLEQGLYILSCSFPFYVSIIILIAT